MGILKFLEALEQVVQTWPEGEKQTFFSIAEQTRFNIPHVIDYLSEGLDRSLDVHEPIARKEAEQALNSLQQRLQHELEADRKRRQARQEKSLQAYNRIMTKVSELSRDKMWHQAYRTLSYFSGTHEPFLDRDSLITIYNDCLRIGGKAAVNLQELGQWLSKGARLCATNGGLDGIAEANDFIEAHEDTFKADSRGIGGRILQNVIHELHSPRIPQETSPQMTQTTVSYPLHNAILD